MDKKIIVGIIVLIVIVALVVTCIFFKKDKDKMVIMKNNITGTEIQMMKGTA